MNRPEALYALDLDTAQQFLDAVATRHSIMS